MKIIVLVKAVPEIAQLRFEPGSKTLARSSVLRVQGFDRRAVEEAILLREKHGGSVSLVSMGPPEAEEALRPLIAMGADDAYLLTDPAFAGADTLATAASLSAASKRIGFDLILGGQRSTDSETGQLLPEVAEMLGTNLVTAVNKVEYSEGRFVVEREYEDGYEVLELGAPATISVTERINRPRRPSDEAIEKAKQARVTKWSAADLGAQAGDVGAAGSMTVVSSIREESYQRSPVVVDGTADLSTAVRKAMDAVRQVLREKPDFRAEVARSRRAKTPRPVWVVFLRGLTETETGLEALGRVKELGMLPVAVLAGCEGDRMESRAAESGAYSILRLETHSEARSSAVCAGAIAAGASAEKPYALLLPSTVLGREVAGRVAVALRAGLTGDATDLLIDDSDELVQVKPAFGGNLVADVVSRATPKIATVRPGALEVAKGEGGGLDSRVLKTSRSLPDVRVLSKRVVVDYQREDALKGRVVIGVGSGVGSTEGFESVRKYGAGLGIPVLGTRKLIDNGWASPPLQVGLTGRHVAADLYVAVAVSGAPYHLVGLKKCRVILAINADPNAPIFKTCDVGLVGDYRAALPLVSDALRTIASSPRT